MEKYLLFVFTIFAFSSSFAQSPIARIKFEQAEEAFQNDQYQNALSNLEEAEKLLGEVNPKILYLRILAQNKLFAKDPGLLPSLKVNCADYLAKTEANSSLHEKYKEVYLISQGLIQLEDDEDHLTGKKLTDSQKDLEALPYYLKAAARGYSKSLNNLGVMYLYGNGVQKDVKKALAYFQSASEKGGLGGQTSMINLGGYYSAGKEIPVDLEKAKLWYSKAAEDGNPTAMDLLALIYFKENNHLKAFQWWKTAAELNNLSAVEWAAFYYLTGKGGIIIDLPKALFYAQKGAEKNSPSALHYLGFMSEYGLGIPVSYSDAFSFYTRSATLEYPKAFDGLVRLYEEGKGVKKDRKIAADWLRKKQELEASRKDLNTRI